MSENKPSNNCSWYEGCKNFANILTMNAWWCSSHAPQDPSIDRLKKPPQTMPDNRRFTEVTKELYELQQKYSALIDEYSEAKSLRVFDKDERDALEWAETVDRLMAGNTHALAFAKMLADARRIKQRGRVIASESAPEGVTEPWKCDSSPAYCKCPLHHSRPAGTCVSLSAKSAVKQESNTKVHLSHCYQGEYLNCCKYGEDNCPAKGITYYKKKDKLTMLNEDNQLLIKSRLALESVISRLLIQTGVSEVGANEVAHVTVMSLSQPLATDTLTADELTMLHSLVYTTDPVSLPTYYHFDKELKATLLRKIILQRREAYKNATGSCRYDDSHSGNPEDYCYTHQAFVDEHRYK